ncbi:MAG: hypothetical protein QOF51_173 [Chloroflexota bacterium]|nr:hypothetical protein [Chloroflexota bacterium]
MRTMPSLATIRARLAEEVSPEVLTHTEATVELARTIAHAHGVDQERVVLAALLHDVAEGYSDRKLAQLAERYNLTVDLTEARVPKLLHAPVGAEVLRREWDIDDEEILDAVRDHVTGSTHMGPIAKVLFLADKLEPSRDRFYGGLNSVRTLAMTDLDAAMRKLYAWRLSELVDADRPIHARFVAARNLAMEQARADTLYG